MTNSLPPVQSWYRFSCLPQVYETPCGICLVGVRGKAAYVITSPYPSMGGSMLHGGNYYWCAAWLLLIMHSSVGEIFDFTVNVGDETIKASRYKNADYCGVLSCCFLNLIWWLSCVWLLSHRWSPTRSYADPKQSFIEQGNVLTSGAETCPSVPNGNITPQKKSGWW